MLVERALQLQPQHVLAYHVKGSLLLTLARPELAIHTFLAAKELSKDVHSFRAWSTPTWPRIATRRHWAPPRTRYRWA